MGYGIYVYIYFSIIYIDAYLSMLPKCVRVVAYRRLEKNIRAEEKQIRKEWFRASASGDGRDVEMESRFPLLVSPPRTLQLQLKVLDKKQCSYHYREGRRDTGYSVCRPAAPLPNFQEDQCP